MEQHISLISKACKVFSYPIADTVNCDAASEPEVEGGAGC